MMNVSTFSRLISKNQDLQQFNPEANIEELLVKLDSEDFSPNDNTIDTILNFARSYNVLESEDTGYIEMILN